MGRIVTLLTDFGTVDGFVGAMKGVVLSRAPEAQVVDLTPEIDSHDLRAGAWALCEASRTFPAGTIHVAVVDPGVGTQRRPILIQHDKQLFVGPDNGVLCLAAPAGPAWHLDNPKWFCEEVSSTFHGRDIFASVAGHLASGVPPTACGTPISDRIRLEQSRASRRGDTIIGEVIHVDRFGNLITNIARTDLVQAPGWAVTLGDLSVGEIRGTFGDVARGEWVAYVGSSGYVEIAVREERADARLAALGTKKPMVTLCRN
jgi:S-adenosylmethionine hydrolase